MVSLFSRNVQALTETIQGKHPLWGMFLGAGQGSTSLSPSLRHLLKDKGTFGGGASDMSVSGGWMVAGGDSRVSRCCGGTFLQNK